MLAGRAEGGHLTRSPPAPRGAACPGLQHSVHFWLKQCGLDSCQGVGTATMPTLKGLGEGHLGRPPPG